MRCCRCVVHCYMPACDTPWAELLRSCTVHYLLCQTVLTVQVRHRHTDSNIVICILYLACLWCWVDAGSPAASPWTISTDHYTYEVFKSMDIMTLYSQYIYSLVLYTINNKHLFDTNNEIYKYKTRNNNNLHRPIANLAKFNKGAYISCIKVFNHLPQYIKALNNDHKYFKSTLKRFLYHHSFYSMNEYYEYKEYRRI